jgi:hypothetical protein
MPLSAARGTWSLPAAMAPHGAPVFLLEQPVLFEKALLEAAAVSAPLIPPHGTVAATAIQLALASTSAPVIVAGLDLGDRDLLTHARPNAFDTLLQLQASRLCPHASLTYHRAAGLGSAVDPRAPGLRITPALRTYAGWLDSGAGAGSARVHRLLPSAVAISSMSSLDARGLHSLLGGVASAAAGCSLSPNAQFPAGDERRRIASRLCRSWTAEIAAARQSLTRPGASGADLSGFPRALTLAHFIAPRRLVDALKKSRTGHGPAAAAAAGEMFTECLSFFDALGEKAIG